MFKIHQDTLVSYVCIQPLTNQNASNHPAPACCGFVSNLSPKVSGTKNGGTVPYKAILGMGFPLHKVYPYSLHIGEDSSILGTQELVNFVINSSCDQNLGYLL